MAHKSLRGRKGTKQNNKSLKAAIKKDKASKKGSKKQSSEELKKGAAQPVPVASQLSKKDKKSAQQTAALEKQHRVLYPGGERVLLVGEGNFSFAHALCQNLESADGIFATAFDNEATLNKKYVDAAENRKTIEDRGGTTLVGVDATRLHEVREFRGAFKKIVWNFPHLGDGEADVEKSIAAHRDLLARFATSAMQCLDPGKSALHIALKIGEPYKSWKVAQTVRAACPELELQTAIPFALGAWPTYAHRRTAGFNERFSKADSEELAKGAKVYVFVRKR